MKRKIGVVTGSRADYGLLYWVIREILNDADCELQLFVTGMHLSPEFGNTVKNIESDSIPITRRVEMLLSSDTPVGISKSVGLGIGGFADVLAESRPDVLLVLGDRFETFAAVVAALVARIPVAHCHGGETTEGAIDEGLRHAITKMSHLHFVSTSAYAERVRQMGENPVHIYTVGALGLENIRRTKLLSKKAIGEVVGFSFDKKLFIVTYHPVTLESGTSESQCLSLLKALDSFPDADIIFTLPNADTDGRVVIKLIEQYVSENSSRCKSFVSLGHVNYLSAIQFCSVVIGNSSSGIIEAPSFHKPTVNIGDRQKGRVAGRSVIHCGYSETDIVTAIREALSTEFAEIVRNSENPYEMGDPAKSILSHLKMAPLGTLVKKKFFDLNPI